MCRTHRIFEIRGVSIDSACSTLTDNINIKCVRVNEGGCEGGLL